MLYCHNIGVRYLRTHQTVMKKYPYYLSSALIALFAAGTAHAQKKTEKSFLQPPPANINIDGNIKEWGDSLRYYNEEKKINYSLANDNENLYMAIRVNDRTEKERILNAGLTWSINTNGKKKEEYSITFPVADVNSLQQSFRGRPDDAANPDDQESDRDQLRKARLTKLRNIKVTGFKDIEGDMITTANTYGIKVAVDFDDNGYLVYEAAIPLKFFHVTNPDKNEWAFNFKINGIQRPTQRPNGEGEGMRGGMGGMGGGMRGGGMRGSGMGGGRRGGSMGGGNYTPVDHSVMSKSEDFWEKFYLAK